MLLSWVAATAFVAGLVYYVAARGWQLKRDMPGYVFGQELDLRDLGRLGRLETGLLKGLAALFLVALAAQFWLGRYELMLSDHGNLMVGIDYLQQNLRTAAANHQGRRGGAGRHPGDRRTPQAGHRLRRRAGGRLAGAAAGREPVRAAE